MFEPGDVMVVYSDGITDATDKNDEAFGKERLLSLIEAHKSKPAAILVEMIAAAVEEHEGGTPQMDDLTLVVVKRSS